MSEQPSPSGSGLRNPQILAALIGAITTIAVALITVIPNLVSSTQPPTSTPTPIIITVTPMPSPTNSSTEGTISTLTPLFQATSDAPATTPTTSNEPLNVRLMYDEVSFTLLNESGHTLSFEGVSFRSSNGMWEARLWGPSIYNRVPDGQCLRLRDRSVGQRQPPPPCLNKIYSLIEVGSTALFWINVENFEVVRNDEVIATCTFEAGECSIHIPRS